MLARAAAARAMRENFISVVVSGGDGWLVDVAAVVMCLRRLMR